MLPRFWCVCACVGVCACHIPSGYYEGLIGEPPVTDVNRENNEIKSETQHLLANDLAELVHIFKENVVVRHSPTPAGEKLSPKICVPSPVIRS